MTTQRRFAVYMLIGLVGVGVEGCRRVGSARLDGQSSQTANPNGPNANGEGCQTCESLGATCGTQSDNCGGTLDCGSCESPNVCDAMTKSCGPCIPQTCESQGKNCGSISDGCGGMLDCTAIVGGCQGNQTCGAEGEPNVCGCKSRSCQDFGRKCGKSIDNCGRELDCDRQIGGCGGGQECDLATYQCFIPNCQGFETCEQVESQLGRQKCGRYPNGCGGFVECGVCPLGNICDAESNECVAFPVRTPGAPNSDPAPNVPCTMPGGLCPDGFYCKFNIAPPLCTNASCSETSANVCIPVACGERVCGNVRDACLIDHACGPMEDLEVPGGSCPAGTSCTENACTGCTPLVAPADCPPRRCGKVSNGCGGTMDCGTSQCESGEICNGVTRRCVAPVVRSCAEQCAFEGKNCGPAEAWNGSTKVSCDCGTCTGTREGCGFGGFPGVCGVTPPDRECLRQQSNCGFVTDSCGNQFACGECPGGGVLPRDQDQKCKVSVTGGNTCQACLESDRLTCANYPGQCGAALPDGCGRFLDCRGNCGAAVCDDSAAGQTVDVCCQVGQVIARPEDSGIPGVLGPTSIPGDCCWVDPASAVCPAGYCGNIQDSCGQVIPCSCGAGIQCDSQPPFAGPSAPTYVPVFGRGATGPVQGLCCQAGQVIGDPNDGNVLDGASGGAIIGVYAQNCCVEESVNTTCNAPGGTIGTAAAPTGLNPLLCGTRENNCGRDKTCPDCPSGSVCAQPADADGNNDAGTKTPAGQCCVRQPISETCQTVGNVNARCGIWEDNCGVDVDCGTACGSGNGCQTDPGICVNCVNFCLSKNYECNTPPEVTGCPVCGTCTGSAIASSLSGRPDGTPMTNTLDSNDYTCVANTCQPTCAAYREINQCDASAAAGLPQDDGTIPTRPDGVLTGCACQGNTNTGPGGGARTFCRATGANGTTGLVDNTNPSFSDQGYVADTCRNCQQLCAEAYVLAGNSGTQCGPVSNQLLGQTFSGCDCGPTTCSGGGPCNGTTGLCCAAGQVVFGGACCTPANPVCGADACDTTLARGCGLSPVVCGCANGRVCNTSIDTCCAPGQVLAEEDSPSIPGGAGVTAGACCTRTPSTPPPGYCGPVEDSCGYAQATISCPAGQSCINNSCCNSTNPCGADQCDVTLANGCGNVSCTCSGGRTCNTATDTCCASGQVLAEPDDPSTPGGNNVPAGQCCTPTQVVCSSIGANYCGPLEDSCGRNTAGCSSVCGSDPDRTCVGNQCGCAAGTTQCNGSQNCCNAAAGEVCLASGSCCMPTPVSNEAQVRALCEYKCGNTSRGCGLTYACGDDYCPGDCSGTTCTCTAVEVCNNASYCEDHPNAGARQVINPCPGGIPTYFNCPACISGGG